MKRSPEFTYGVYQFEFREDYIEVVEWKTPPLSTKQWVNVEKPENIMDQYKTYYLEGTCNEDIKLLESEPAFETFVSGG